MGKHYALNENKRGPLVLRVLVYDIGSATPIRNFSVVFRRKKEEWIARMIVWAATNNKLITIVNADDHKDFYGA